MKTRTQSMVVGACIAFAAAAIAPDVSGAGPTRKTAQGASAPAAPPAKAEAPKDPIAEARTHHQRGVELYTDGDYKLALIEFQRSYEIVNNWRILFNIGEVHFQLNNYAQALKALEKYLAEGGNEIPGKRRVDVERDIEALKARTGFITVECPVEGAEVSIGETVVGKTPITTELLVDAGTQRITVTKNGFKPLTKTVTLAGREHLTVPIDLQPDTPLIATPPPESSQSYVWAGWVATGALATGAVVTGLLGMGAESDLEELRARQPVSRAELDDKEAEMKRFAIATDILAASAVIAGGISLYFTLKGSGTREAPPTEARKPTIRAGAGLGSVFVGGTF